MLLLVYGENGFVNSMKYHKLLMVLGAIGIAGGGAVLLLNGEDKITLDTSTAQKIVWDKPKTDEKWAEDTKNENIADRSTAVLNQMLDSHIPKLEREEKAFAMYVEMEAQGQDPVQYLYWKHLDTLRQSYPNETSEWYQSEALKQAQEQYDRELRDKGFVVVEGEEGIFGGLVPDNRVRHVID